MDAGAPSKYFGYGRLSATRKLCGFHGRISPGKSASEGDCQSSTGLPRSPLQENALISAKPVSG